ncbi:hypothetical protein C1H46_022918 [Malus baccata]|uniref:DUF4283 domain-containing protein n=1 Tax=Malus baccata TaxID=106549 RepID=A0A540LYF3_MALBA|nr:hypothetical protein C1H46_022918 [Malus baccata]
MVYLWRPKAKVTIVELDDDRFSIGFKNERERAMVLKGGPWLYDGALLILAEADTLANPNEIPLYTQEFWVQVKGLPLAYMTRRMGQFIGNQLVGHTEKQCELFEGKNNDDLSKPYGRWFQNDVLDANYLKAPLSLEEEEDDTVFPVVRSPGTETNGLVVTGVDGSSGGVPGAEQERRGNNGSIDLPDLNEGVDSEAIGPFQGPPTVTKLEAVIHGEDTANSGGLRLFGYDLNASRAGTEEVSPNLVLQLSVNGMGRVGPRSSTHAVMPQIPVASEASGTFGMGSDRLELMPIIEQSGMPFPMLGKRFEREGEDVFAPSGSRRRSMLLFDNLSLSAEVDGVQPCRTQSVA